ncbi:SDR family NAD(P)-dependent oxidoreductase [Novosphingobium guangzhouense]|uniref:SDR family NAD(P)-dependent oxidoreductase n=1 Tax=Novosphingobium guangzhouense TaxID=1850347 RepID=UPI003CCBE32A
MVSLFDLAGKVARETGASRGIDRAVVEALAEAGARVAVSSGTQAACEEVVATINVVSLNGAMIGADNISAYNMSKAADLQPVRNLAVEPGDSNIRVNAITPGGIRTDFAKPLWEDPAAEFRLCEALPLGRIGEPTGIGGAAFFLASQAAPYITGQSIIIDGEATVRGVH